MLLGGGALMNRIDVIRSINIFLKVLHFELCGSLVCWNRGKNKYITQRLVECLKQRIINISG